MSDAESDRALIDRYIAKHGVTKVPRGASGLLDEDGKLKPGAFKFGPTRKKGRPKKAQPPPQPEPAPDVPARRANTERFAAALDAAPAPEPKAPEKPPTAHTAAARSRASQAGPKADPALDKCGCGRWKTKRFRHCQHCADRPQRKPDAAKRERYRETLDGTRTAREAAEHLGVAEVTVRKMAAIFELPLKPSVPGGTPGKRAERAAPKKERVREMHGQNATVREMAIDIGVTETLEQLRDERDHLKAQLAELTGVGAEILPGLTRSESRVVRVLERAKGQVLSHHALMTALYWDRIKEEPEIGIVTVMISQIRKRRPDLGARIVTSWGEGYAMMPGERTQETADA